MGCSAYHKLASEHEVLASRLNEIVREKDSIYDDKLLLETEVNQMKKNAYQAINESESLKTKIDYFQSTLNPAIFENGASDTDLIADWMQLDLRDGDRLLQALSSVYPPSSKVVLDMLKRSRRMREQDDSLKDYLEYFEDRFEVFNSVWKEVLSSQRLIDDTVASLKEDIVSSIQGVESFLGKRSTALEGLQGEFRVLSTLSTADFLVSQRAIQKRLADITTEVWKKRLEEKDLERQRIIAHFEADIKKIKQIYAAGSDQFEKEKRDRETLVQRLVEQGNKDLILGFKDKEEELNMRIQMLGEELLGNALRNKEEKDGILIKLEKAIRENKTRISQGQEMQKQDWENQLRRVEEESSKLKQELLLKDQELQSAIESSETDKLSLISRLQHEIQSLKSEFASKSALESAIFQDQLSAAVQQHAIELQAQEEKIKEVEVRLTQEAEASRLSFQQMIEILKSEHAQEMAIKDRHLATTKRAHEAALKIEGEKLKWALQDLTTKVKKEVEVSESELKQALETAQAEKIAQVTEALQTRFKGELESLRKEHNLQLAEVASKHSREIAEKESIYRELEIRHSAAIQTLKDDFAREKKQLSTSNVLELSQLEAKVKRLEADTGSQLQRKIDQFSEEIATLKANQKREIEQMQSRERERTVQAEADFTAAKKLWEREKALLRLDFDNAKSEHFNEMSQRLGLFAQERMEMQMTIERDKDDISQKDSQIAYLRTQLSHAEKRVYELKTYSDSVLEQLQSSQQTERDVQRFQSRKEMTDQELTGQEELLKRYREDLSHRDAKIRELAETQRVKDTEFHALQRRRALHSSLTMTTMRIQGLKKIAMTQWKQYDRVRTSIKASEEGSIRLSIASVPGAFMTSLGDPTRTSQEIERAFNEEKRLIFEQSPLNTLYRSVSWSEKPLTPQKAFKLMEDMMERKVEADRASFMRMRPAKSIPEFVLQHLVRIFSNKKQANKTLGQALLCLHSLVRENQPYAELFCRLLNVISPDPVSKEMGVFLTRVWSDFGKLADYYQKETSRNREVSALMGGSAFLIDVISYVYDLFDSDSKSGEIVLRLIKPEEVPFEEFVIFKICHRMAKSSVNAEDTFAQIDVSRSGRIRQEDFAEGIRSSLGLWVSSEELNSAFSAIANGGKTLKRDQFLDKLNFKKYLDDGLSEKFAISKCAFLRAVLEACTTQEKRTAGELLALIGTESPVSREKFFESIKELDPKIDDERLDAIWRLAERLSPEGVTPRALIRILMKSPVGRYAESVYCRLHIDMRQLDPLTTEPESAGSPSEMSEGSRASLISI